MNLSRAALDLWVGVFVALGIGAILFLALKVGNLINFASAPGYRLEARFDNIGGLKLRAPVKAAGVVVGRVEAIKLDPTTYQAIVALKIDQGYQFTAPNKAKAERQLIRSSNQTTSFMVTAPARAPVAMARPKARPRSFAGNQRA